MSFHPSSAPSDFLPPLFFSDKSGTPKKRSPYEINLLPFVLSLVPHSFMEAIRNADIETINKVNHSTFNWFDKIPLSGGSPFIALTKKTLSVLESHLLEEKPFTDNLSKLIFTVVHVAHCFFIRQPEALQITQLNAPYCFLNQDDKIQIESNSFILRSFCDNIHRFFTNGKAVIAYKQGDPAFDGIRLLKQRNDEILAHLERLKPALQITIFLTLEDACEYFCLSSLGFHLIQNSVHDELLSNLLDRLKTNLSLDPLTSMEESKTSPATLPYPKKLVRVFIRELERKCAQAQKMPSRLGGGASGSPSMTKSFVTDSRGLNAEEIWRGLEVNQIENPIIKNEKGWFRSMGETLEISLVFNQHHPLRGGTYAIDYCFKVLKTFKAVLSGQTSPETEYDFGEMIFIQASICSHLIKAIIRSNPSRPDQAIIILNHLSLPYLSANRETRSLQIKPIFSILKENQNEIQRFLTMIKKTEQYSKIIRKNPDLSKAFEACNQEVSDNLKLLSELETRKKRELGSSTFAMSLLPFPEACKLFCLPSLVLHLCENPEHDEAIPDILNLLSTELSGWQKTRPDTHKIRKSGYPCLAEILEIFIETLQKKMNRLFPAKKKSTPSLSAEEQKKKEEEAERAAAELLAELEAAPLPLVSAPPTRKKKGKMGRTPSAKPPAPKKATSEKEPDVAVSQMSTPLEEPFLCGAGGPLTLAEREALQRKPTTRDTEAPSPASDAESASDQSSTSIESLESPPPTPPLKPTKPPKEKRSNRAAIPPFFTPYEPHHQLVRTVLEAYIPPLELDQKLWVYGSILEEDAYVLSRSGDIDFALYMEAFLSDEIIRKITESFLKQLRKRNSEENRDKVTVSFNAEHHSWALKSADLNIDLLILTFPPLSIREALGQKMDAELFEHKARRFNPHTGEFLKKSEKQTLSFSRRFYLPEALPDLNTIAYFLKNLAITQRALHKTAKSTFDFMLRCFSLSGSTDIDPKLYARHFIGLSLAFLKYPEHTLALLTFCQTHQLIIKLLSAIPRKPIELISLATDPTPFLSACLSYKGTYPRSAILTIKSKPGFEARRNQEMMEKLLAHAAPE
jgi:hypothetical protein